jgi:hypothetical protein
MGTTDQLLWLGLSAFKRIVFDVRKNGVIVLGALVSPLLQKTPFTRKAIQEADEEE